MKKNLIHETMAPLFVLVVCISSAAAVGGTVTRDLPASASAGATITVDLTVDVETGARYCIIDEIVPSGWTVTSATGGGYISDTGHVKWVVVSGATDTVYSYTVLVPAGASGTYMFEGITVEATILGDTTMTVGAVPTVSLGSVEGSVGDTVNVPITITDASKICAMDIRVTYDPNILNATNVANGSMMQDLPDLLWASDVSSEGRVNISLATYPGMINGTGELFVVTLDIVGGDTGDSSILAINAEACTGEVPPQSVAVAVENGYVTVTEPPVLTTIMVSPSTADLTIGGTQLFTATACDQYGAPMAGIVITWMSTNSAAGTVDPLSATTGSDGTATTTFMAVAEGTITVAAISGDVYGTAAVTVTPPSLPVVTITTDASTYSPGGMMIVTLDIANPTSDPVTFEWYMGVPHQSIWVTYAKASIPDGFDNSYTIPIPVGNWGPTPFDLVHYVRMLDPVSGEVLVWDVARCTYSPGVGEVMPVDIAEELSKTVEAVEFSI